MAAVGMNSFITSLKLQSNFVRTHVMNLIANLLAIKFIT